MLILEVSLLKDLSRTFFKKITVLKDLSGNLFARKSQYPKNFRGIFFRKSQYSKIFRGICLPENHSNQRTFEELLRQKITVLKELSRNLFFRGITVLKDLSRIFSENHSTQRSFEDFFRKSQYSKIFRGFFQKITVLKERCENVARTCNDKMYNWGRVESDPKYVYGRPPSRFKDS